MRRNRDAATGRQGLIRRGRQNFWATPDFVRRHPGFALRDEVQINLVAGTRPARRFASRASEPGRAHVLDADNQPVFSHHFETGFEQKFFHERIAHLHRRAVLLRFLGEFPAGKRRPGQAIAPGCAAYVDHRVADAFRLAALDLVVPNDAERERVDERVAVVGFVEIHFAADGRDADAIPVMRDPGHDTGEQPPIRRGLR